MVVAFSSVLQLYRCGPWGIEFLVSGRLQVRNRRRGGDWQRTTRTDDRSNDSRGVRKNSRRSNKGGRAALYCKFSVKLGWRGSVMF